MNSPCEIVSPSTARSDILQDSRNIFGFAAILSASFTAVGLIGEALRVVDYSLLPASACGIAGLALSLFAFYRAPHVRRLPMLNRWVLVSYVFLATLAIHFAGGPQSFLTGLYIGITIATAFLVGWRGSILIALLSFACFSVLIGLEFVGAVPVYPLWSSTLAVEGRGAVLSGLLFSMAVPTFIVAYVAGTLAERIAKRTAEQAALALIARDITASLNSEHVIRTVLRRAMRHTPSDRGGIHLIESDQVRVVAIEGSGFDMWLPAGGSASPVVPVTVGIVGRVLRTGQSARVGNAQRDPDYFAAAPETRSELCVPIVQDNRVQGVINLESNRPHAYSSADQRFVEQLAQYAAIAMVNADLYDKTERNLHEVARANLEIQALQESLFAVQSASELNQILQRICDAVVSLGYDLATLSTVDRQTARLDVRAVATNDADLIQSLESLLRLPLVGMHTKLTRQHNIGVRSLAEKRVLVSGRANDFLYPLARGGRRSRALDALGLRVGAAIPLIARDMPLGVLYAVSRRPELAATDLASLQAFGAQAALALDKANLFEEARTVRDRLQAVLDAAHDGLMFFDVQTRMVLLNQSAERLLGVALTPHLGKPMALVLERSGLLERLYPGLNPNERKAVVDTEVNVMNAGLRDGTGEVARRLIQVPGHETRYVEEFSMRVQDDQHRLIGRLIVLHDVSDHKQLEADRDAFTQMLVHDLRSPLSAIIGSLQLIELGLTEGDPIEVIRKSVRVALASAHKLLDLIGSLLDVQKLETGQLQLQLQPLAAASLIQDAIGILKPLADMNDIALDGQADHNLPTLLGDPEHVRRVLMNLLDNAIKFVGAGGRVSVSASRDDGSVRFIVTDNGPGIPPEYRDRIFERYVQVPGRTGRRRGTGLGLTYCKMVVEMHGGRIWVESPAGGGSVFVFTLPANETE